MPRTIELALLAFVSFCLIRGLIHGNFDPVTFLPRHRGISVVSVMLVIVTAATARRFLRIPWPPTHVNARRAFRMAAILPFIPIAFITYVLSQSEIMKDLDGLAVRHKLLFLEFHLQTLGMMCPLLLLWLLFGIDGKTNEHFVATRFIKQQFFLGLAALRAWAPIVMCLGFYPMLHKIMGDPDYNYDAQLEKLDEWIFGVDPRLALEPLISQPLSEWMAFAYTFFAALFPLVVGVAYWKYGERALREITFTLGLALLGSYVSYTLIPVGGPLLTQHFSVSLELYIIEPVKEALMDRARITWDCFPSMHTADTVILSFFAWKYSRRLFWVLLPVTASIPFACVYLRYHYVVDVVAGILFALFFLALNKWVRPKIDSGYEPVVAPEGPVAPVTA